MVGSSVTKIQACPLPAFQIPVLNIKHCSKHFRVDDPSLHGEVCRMASSEICSTRCLLAHVDTHALVAAFEDAVAFVVNGDCVARVSKDVGPGLTSIAGTNEHAVLSSTSDAHDDSAAVSSVPSTMTDPTNRSSTLKIVGLFAVSKEFAAEDKSG
jgi:hypothetical protein